MGHGRLADRPPVQDQPVVRVARVSRRNEFDYVVLDLSRRLTERQTEAVSDAEDVRIHRERRLRERDR